MTIGACDADFEIASDGMTGLVVRPSPRRLRAPAH
jgi:hypothetical protein